MRKSLYMCLYDIVSICMHSSNVYGRGNERLAPKCLVLHKASFGRTPGKKLFACKGKVCINCLKNVKTSHSSRELLSLADFGFIYTCITKSQIIGVFSPVAFVILREGRKTNESKRKLIEFQNF